MMSFYPNLKSWIERHGGYVHPELILTKGSGTGGGFDRDNGFAENRGIVAKSNIAKRNLLVRIPPDLVLSGEQVPWRISGSDCEQRKTLSENPLLGFKKNKGEVNARTRESSATDNAQKDDTVTVSPWLRCLCSLMFASAAISHTKENRRGEKIEISSDEATGKCDNCFSSVNFTPYLESLPERYDTLIDWTEEELAFLRGTALGRIVFRDRECNSLQSRFQTYVRPVLRLLLGSRRDIEEQCVSFQAFMRAAQCISTRGFHLSDIDNRGQQDCNGGINPTTAMAGRPPYAGPFLIPFIDMLNHEPCPSKKCTTLRRDPKDKSFYMIAERDIHAGEEVFHSYGENLTSAQLLHTFGFVHRDTMVTVASVARAVQVTEGVHLTKGWDDDGGMVSMTPAIISRELLIRSCYDFSVGMKVERLREHIRNEIICDETYNDEDKHEEWDPSVCWEEKVSYITGQNSLIPEDIIVEVDNPLNEYLVTCCSVLFLPKDAFQEIFLDNCASLLDKSILEDYLLEQLVCMALVEAVDTCLQKYGNEVTSNEGDRLSVLLEKRLNDGWVNCSRSERRIMEALTVSVEERLALESLKRLALARVEVREEQTTSDRKHSCGIEDDHNCNKKQTKRTKL